MDKYKSPVYNIIAVPIEKVVANEYNPNIVAPPEMKLLELSIWEDGYTMPCVCYYRKDEDVYEIVDGFHRYQVMKTSPRIYEREKGLLPVSVIDKDLSERMASTIRHNRARGMHSVELMSHIVSELTKSGMSDSWIIRNIGMDKDELLRLKQISGLAELLPTRLSARRMTGRKNNPIGETPSYFLEHNVMASELDVSKMPTAVTPAHPPTCQKLPARKVPMEPPTK